VGSSVRIAARPVVVPPNTITAGRRVPFMIEKAQAYYWTTKWMESLDKAIADIQSGNYMRFNSDDPTDVARWLMDGKDD
jgi:hypothetical protein